MTMKKRQPLKKEDFSPAEQRAARSERIIVSEAEPYGWMARSEASTEADYHLFCEPQTRRLACTCADFIFRGNAEPGYECKHVSAVLKFIARKFLETDYDPRRQQARAA
ncbi:MAG: hypothetical protein LC731_01415 [Acidobacteria bacterium]|nr:hypothetical protein [Acidobacteriota bacterium]